MSSLFLLTLFAKTIIHILNLGIISSFQSEIARTVRTELKTSLKLLPIFNFESKMKEELIN